MKKLCTLLFLAMVVTCTAYAQRNNNGAWRSSRHNVTVGAGFNVFMGDLGGGNGEGGHFMSFRDIDPNYLKAALMGQYRYRLGDRLAARFSLLYTNVGADDAEAGREVRRLRNLNFKSVIIEGALGLEYNFLREKEIPRYSNSVNFWKKWSGYFTVNFGMFHFNPKGRYEGEWYELQPLCTEGQGSGVEYKVGSGRSSYVVTANDPYKRMSVSVPIGIGFRYQLDRQMSIGFELLQHFTTTDYIDDCSTYYFNYESEGITPPSEMTTIFADRRIGSHKTVTGQQRGNSGYNDTFFTAMITIQYKLNIK